MSNSVDCDIGMIAESLAGRDKGRFFVILEVLDDKYVLVADGRLRRVDKPKKKQLKHLKVKPVAIPIIKEKLASGDKLYDYEIRSHLTSLGYNIK